MLNLVDELRKIVGLLDEQGIEYALCGGLAMSVYARARSTIDIDLLILSESLGSVLEIASKLDYTIRGKDLSFANGAVEIRRVSKIDQEDGDLLSLDLLLVTPDIREVWDTRVEAEWLGGKLSVVSKGGLIALKELRGSGQDSDDIKALKGEGLDES
jgi:hypothetical protein